MSIQEAVSISNGHFNAGYGCAESVLLAIAEYKGIKSDLIPRIATGFCGGMARTDGMCGAVTGAVLSLNLLLGRDDASQSIEGNYQAIQSFIARFKEQFGGINCTELTGCNLGTKEGQDEFNRKDLHKSCTMYVEEATRLVLGSMEG